MIESAIRGYQSFFRAVCASKSRYESFRKLTAPIRTSPLKKIYDLQRSKTQLKDYTRLVRRSDALPLYNEERTRNELSAKARARRSIAKEQPRVVAFGFEDWEKQGLWPSLCGVTQCSFHELTNLMSARGGMRPGAAHRQSLAEACLEQIDAMDAAGSPPALAFFYVDSESLAPALFEGLRNRGVWSIVMGLDDKHRYALRWERGVHVGQETLIREADLLWTTWRTGARLISGTGGTAWYAPPGADPDYHRDLKLNRDIDVLFLGQRYGRREELVETLRSSGLSVVTAGRGWRVGHIDFERGLELTSRAKIVVGLGDTGGMVEVGCLKGRDFEVPMSGALYLTSFSAELADAYLIAQEVHCYRTFTECAEICHWLLADDDHRQVTSLAGQLRARASHTWKQRFSDLLGLFPRET